MSKTFKRDPFCEVCGKALVKRDGDHAVCESDRRQGNRPAVNWRERHVESDVCFTTN